MKFYIFYVVQTANLAKILQAPFVKEDFASPTINDKTMQDFLSFDLDELVNSILAHYYCMYLHYI